MGQFFDAYQKWPPQNQMLFAIAAMVIGAVMLFVIGWWLSSLVRELFHYIAVWVRGWPKDEAPTPTSPSANASDMATLRALLDEVRQRPILVGPSANGSMPGGLPSVGPDWREMARRHQEDMELQAQLQQRAQEELEQANHAKAIAPPMSGTEEGATEKKQEGAPSS